MGLTSLGTPAASVGVVGGGLMGRGIAQVAAQAGIATVVRELTPSLADTARDAVRRSLDKAIEKAKLSPDARDAAMARLTFTTQLADLASCDIVIEAVVEDLEVKNALWRELDAICGAATIFASNTSSLTIAAMAAASGRGDRIVGLHFFNPVPLMRLVEVVRTITTSDVTFDRAMALVRQVGKQPVVARDSSGFVVNRLLIPYMLDAIRALENGVGSITDIDAGMQLGAGHPMGPFTLLDYVGLDTVVRVAEVMYEEYREQRFAPPPLLRRLVMAGHLGRKAGRGFYDHSVDPPVPSKLLA
ncbi:MAG TPA: 3-hydroxybutyryl-CoA dehydrogenase [Gemmatimonadaceae bacterium]|nr:3-hydroxybutyryl-CoA dehydrogenase [Gemmatimonadaceae bacterium]